jgi:hypothetical protein
MRAKENMMETHFTSAPTLLYILEMLQGMGSPSFAPSRPLSWSPGCESEGSNYDMIFALKFSEVSGS